MTPELGQDAWFRAHAVETAARYNEPVIYLPDGVRRDPGTSTGSHGVLPYLTLLRQADSVEKNTPDQELITVPAGDTVQ